MAGPAIERRIERKVVQYMMTEAHTCVHFLCLRTLHTTDYKEIEAAGDRVRLRAESRRAWVAILQVLALAL
jgi:hypothetical protein